MNLISPFISNAYVRKTFVVIDHTAHNFAYNANTSD